MQRLVCAAARASPRAYRAPRRAAHHKRRAAAYRRAWRRNAHQRQRLRCRVARVARARSIAPGADRAQRRQMFIDIAATASRRRLAWRRWRRADDALRIRLGERRTAAARHRRYQSGSAPWRWRGAAAAAAQLTVHNVVMAATARRASASRRHVGSTIATRYARLLLPPRRTAWRITARTRFKASYDGGARGVAPARRRITYLRAATPHGSVCQRSWHRARMAAAIISWRRQRKWRRRWRHQQQQWRRGSNNGVWRGAS